MLGAHGRVMLVPIIDKPEVRQDGFPKDVPVDLIHLLLCEVTCSLAAQIPIAEPLGFLPRLGSSFLLASHFRVIFSFSSAARSVYATQ